MRNFGFILLPALVLGSVAATAQTVTEAYNLSNTGAQGTARSMGFGNTLGSVGGDFSSLGVNPAGLGIYRTSELSITPGLRLNATSSDYIGTTTTDNNTRMTLNNFGLVFTNAPKGKRYDHRNWKTVSFAFGMNRVADFNQDHTYQGLNSSSSGSQVFESDANQNPGNVKTPGTYGYLGYQSYLINDTGNKFNTVVPFAGGINQLKNTHQWGGINEYAFSLGGNYKEKLMLGITVGLPVVNYNSSSYYTETLAAGNNTNPYNFNYFTYGQQQSITGAGINAKLGAIYKLADFIRIGAAFHSPTYYNISDAFNPSISANAQGQSTFLTGNDQLGNTINYHLMTPWKGVASATFILNGRGFITADYEYVAYNTMRYQFGDGYDYSSGTTFQQEADGVNQNISKSYQGVSNFRLGGEVVLNKFFMLRAGFGYYGNAFTQYGMDSSLSYTTQRIDVSGGLGFHFRHFFTDLGLVHSMYQGFERPYVVNYSNGSAAGPVTEAPTAKINYNLNNLAWTLGVKF